MANNGRGGNNRRRSARRRGSSSFDSAKNDIYPQRHTNRGNDSRPGDVRSGEAARFDKSRGALYDRPRWSPPVLSSEPLPAPDCPFCGRPVKDISAAITDKTSGEPVHFDCIIARIAEGEVLEQGDTITYIGGGRFGIVHFNKPPNTQDFKIKKILEWEDKENRAEWRKLVSDHYSVT